MADMIDTNTLRLFDEIARSGSFTAAAELLGYTQSAVSRRIAVLEREARGPLFERLARGVRLTPAGEALLRHATAVLDRLERAEEDLAAIHAGFGGTLRVGAFATANIELVPMALKAYNAVRPDVRVWLTEALSGGLFERLNAGSLDVAVVSDYPSGYLPGDAELLLEDQLLVALPRDHPLAVHERLDLADLAGEPWIEAAPRGQPTQLVAACAAAGFVPRSGPRVAEWSAKFGFVAAGLGLTLVPALAARAVPHDVVTRTLTRGPTRRVYAALPERPLPAALELVEELRRQASELLGQ